MKLKIKNSALCLAFLSLLLFHSCGDDFLDVTDPLVMSKDTYPQTVDDLEPILVDLYGRLPEGYFGGTFRLWPLLSHERDHGYNGAQYNEFALNELTPTLSNVRSIWAASYEAISKCNTFLASVANLRSKTGLTDAEITKLDQYEGQARFLRGFNYFYLINLFGETPILTEADKSKMGIPLWDTPPQTINNVSKVRSTQGEVWDFIIADFTAAETLLQDVVFTQKARVNEWAVKSFLGKSYIFTLQWEKARVVLKDVIDNSGKELVSYDILRTMFNGKNEFNKESIFEINATRDPLNTTGTNIAMYNTGVNWMRGISVSYIDAAGKEQTNGFGNMFMHDMNIPRYGFDDTTSFNQKRPDYIAKSKQVRLDKSVDPRLYVAMFQPYVDSIYYEGHWRMVAKNRVESYNAKTVKAWCHHKYNIIDRYFNDNNTYQGINMYAMRLAEVYLLYAEALIKSPAPDVATALEYINRVHRRAYDQPTDAASVYDYTSLTDRTKTVDPADPLANDILKYERWAEFCGEGQWWFDVRRFGMGAQEAGYYKKVMGGALVWRETKYALPIPIDEINSNSEIIPNPGY